MDWMHWIQWNHWECQLKQKNSFMLNIHLNFQRPESVDYVSTNKSFLAMFALENILTLSVPVYYMK